MKWLAVACLLIILSFAGHSLALDKDPTPPAPNRPYYDASGNKYDYNGNLIEPAAQTEPPKVEGFTGK